MSNLEKIKTESPVEAIFAAVKSGADLEKLKGLLELQERWEANEAKKAYHRAMAQFKANPPKIEKDKAVSFGAGKTSYRHASLFNVVDKITKELSKYGLSANWRTQQNGVVAVTCRITHELGHTEETTLTAPADASGSKNAIQAIGSAVTYLQRYTLLSALGLATTDQDDDGAQTIDEVITSDQLSKLVDMIAHTKTDEAKFCQYLGIEMLEELRSSQFQKAINALNVKAKQVKK